MKPKLTGRPASSGPSRPVAKNASLVWQKRCVSALRVDVTVGSGSRPIATVGGRARASDHPLATPIST